MTPSGKVRKVALRAEAARLIDQLIDSDE